MIKVKSVKSNFFYSFIVQASNFIFPLITFPIIARALLPNGIGQIDFSFAFAQNFIIFSTLGIPIYGLREISRLKTNRHSDLILVTSEIFLFNSFTVLISYLVFLISIFSFFLFSDYTALLFIASVNILLSFFGTDWFFQAINEYKFIAIRTLIVKVLSAVLIIFFINNPTDIIVYSLIAMFSTSANYIINAFKIRKLISFKYFNPKLILSKHLKNILKLSLLSLIVNIYAVLDKQLLSIIAGDEQMGFYSAAFKVFILVVSLIITFNVILLPRFSMFIKTGDNKSLNNLFIKAFNLILLISFPASTGIFFLAEPIILLLAGSTYYDSIFLLKILSFVIPLVALSNLIGIQFFISLNKEKLTIISSSIGCTVSIILNFALLPLLFSLATAVSLLISELTVTFIQLLMLKRFSIKFIKLKDVIVYIIGSVLISINLFFIKTLDFEYLLEILVSTFTSIFIYFMFLILVKNKLVLEVRNNLLSVFEHFFKYKFKNSKIF